MQRRPLLLCESDGVSLHSLWLCVPALGSGLVLYHHYFLRRGCSIPGGTISEAMLNVWPIYIYVVVFFPQGLRAGEEGEGE